MTKENDIPAAHWREFGDKDPHGSKYECRRSDLPYGGFTDDQIANAVFTCNHRTSLASIGLLEAAKERIRWLSRQNEDKAARIAQLEQSASDIEAIASAATDVLHHYDAFGCVTVENPTAKTAMRKFREALTKAKETAQ